MRIPGDAPEGGVAERDGARDVALVTRAFDRNRGAIPRKKLLRQRVEDRAVFEFDVVAIPGVNHIIVGGILCEVRCVSHEPRHGKPRAFRVAFDTLHTGKRIRLLKRRGDENRLR